MEQQHDDAEGVAGSTAASDSADSAKLRCRHRHRLDRSAGRKPVLCLTEWALRIAIAKRWRFSGPGSRRRSSGRVPGNMVSMSLRGWLQVDWVHHPLRPKFTPVLREIGSGRRVCERENPAPEAR